MAVHRIAAIPGDGIGQEVITAGLEVLAALQARTPDLRLEVATFDWGSEYYRRHGRMMPEDGLDRLDAFDAIFFGAVGWPDFPDHVTLWGLRLAICQGFDQYANVRPARLLPGIPARWRDRAGRTSTGSSCAKTPRANMLAPVAGCMSARPRRSAPSLPCSPVRPRADRALCVRAGALRPRQELTNGHQEQCPTYSLVLWDEIFDEQAREFPEVATERSWSTP